VVLHTIAGDVVLAFYPDAAPGHVQQILALARAGVFDTTHFFRIEPNFVAQISVAEDRTTPLTESQKGLIHKLKAELHPTLKHHRGTLSMAHADGDVDSGETSFSILLADAPHLDGQYTIFGF